MTARSKPVGNNTAKDWKARLREENNYEYINARLRARRRDFIEWSEFPAAVGESPAELEQRLLRTSYGDLYRKKFMLEDMPLAVRLERLAYAFAQARFDDLKSWGKGPAGLLISLLSLGADLENAQLCLRLLKTGSLREAAFVPGCGALPAGLVRQIARARGDRGLIAEYCRYDASDVSAFLAQAINVLDETGSVWEAEWSFMKDLFGWAQNVLTFCRDENARLVRQIVALLQDLWNMRIWRGLHGGVGGGKQQIRYLGGGTIPLESLLFSKSFKALISGTFWQSADQSVFNERSLFDMECQFLRWQMKKSREDPLGVHVAVSYTARLYSEWRNLMTLLAGSQMKMDRSLMTSLLVIG